MAMEMKALRITPKRKKTRKEKTIIPIQVVKLKDPLRTSLEKSKTRRKRVDT